MAKTSSKPDSRSNGSALGFEATLWATADKLRGNLDAAEYKILVPDRSLLKYISDAFAERNANLLPKLLSGELRLPAP